MRGLVLAGALVLLAVGFAYGQQMTSSQETITVSTTAIGITADLCGTGNRGGAYVQVLSNGVYFCTNLTASGTACTPDSGDFTLNSGTVGPQFWIKPAAVLRMIRQSADSSVKVQCSE